MKKLYTLLCVFTTFLCTQALLAQTFNGQGGVLVPPGAPTQTVGISTSIATVSGIGIIGTGCTTIDHVDINFTHTFVGDVALFLIGPGGQVLELSSGNGGGGDNYLNTVFTDNTANFITAGAPPYTGTFRPEGRQTNTVPPFSNTNPLGTFTFANTFNGTNADGNWTLLINDFVAIDWGTINSWSITFTSGGGPPPVANAGPDQTICAGQPAILNATATPSATSFAWSNGANTASTTVTPAVTTSYIVTVTNNGCIDTDTVMVIIGSGAGSVNAGPDVAVCNGLSTTLTASSPTPGATFAWSTGQSGSSISVSPATTTTYSVTATAAGCVATDLVTVTVNAAPIANAGADQAVCSGQNALLNASGGGTYAWSSGQNGQQINVNPLITTLYTVTVTLNGCTDTDDALVNVTPNPAVNAGNNVVICNGETTTLIATGGPGNFVWSNGQSGQSITVSPSSTQAYSVTVTSGTCVAEDEVLVIVSPAIANAGNDQSICAGQTATLNASGGGFYAWSSGQATQTISVNPATTTTYTVTVTAAGGCTATDNVSVSVTPAPIANAGTDQVVCEGELAILSASGGATYEWSTGQSVQAITVQPFVTTTFTVTAINGLCTSNDQVTVIVNPSPATSAGADQNICSGETTSLIASGLNGGGTYSWNTGNNSPIIVITPLVTTIYSVTATNASGCSATDEATVVVNPTPNANAGADVSLCTGSSATLAATGGGSYNWSNNQTSAAIIVSPLATTTYTVTVTSFAGCSDTDAATVTLLPAPIANAGVDATICAGDVASLLATGGGTYAWSTGQGFAAINVSPNVTTNYSVTVTNAGGCTATDAVGVTVLPTPIANAGPDQTLCAGEFASLLATGGGNYLWNGGQTSASISVNPGTTTPFSVTVTNNGCSASDDVTVFINPLPVANAGPNVSITTGESATLVATGSGTFIWSNGQAGSTITVNPLVTTTYIVTLTLNGCIATDEVTVFVNEPPQVDLGPDLTLCAGESATLAAAANAPNNMDFAWSTGAVTPSITVSPLVTTNYSVTVTVNGLSSMDTVTVFVNTAPLAAPAITGDGVVCDGTSNNYSIVQVAGATGYVWTVPAGASIVSGQNALAIVVDWGNAAGSVSVVASNACGDSPATLLPVQVNTSPPTPGPIDGTLQPCATAVAAYDIPLLPDAQQYNWSLTGGGQITTGQGTPQISVDWNNTSGAPQLCVTAENACGLSAPLCQTIMPTTLPVADAGTDAAICGTNITLNAAGTGTWSLVSGPGTANFANAGSSASPVTVSLPGAYNFTWTIENNGCTAEDEVAIVFNQNPVTTALSEDCNINNDAYTVSFSITGGQAPYAVNGLGMAGTSFTSAILNSGDTYDFVVTDLNGCEAPAVQGVKLCNCSTDVGNMSLTTIDVCAGEVAEAQYLGGESLDGNDVLAYALHDGAALPNILATNDAANFSYDASLDFETTYYISAIVGNDDGSGFPDFGDPCVALSAGQPVIFHALPTASISGADTLCPLDCAALDFAFTGNAPFVLTYFDGSNNETLSSPLAAQSETVCPNVTTTFTLLEVSDAFCENAAAGTVTLTVALVPNSGVPAAPVALCAGAGQAVALAGLLTGASPGGVWDETSATPSSGSAFNAAAATFNPAGQIAGTYTFSYEVIGQAGCPSTTSTVSVVIQALPVADAGADFALNCSTANALLGGSGTSVGAGIGYLWSNGGTAINNNVSQPGLYSLTVTSANGGCTATDAVNVSGDFAPPLAALTASGNVLTCLATSQTLDGSASTPAGLVFAWSLNGNPLGNTNSSWSTASEGCYDLVVTNPANACADTATVCLTLDIAEPTLNINSPGQLTCKDSTVTLNATASAGGAAMSFEWSAISGNIVGGANAQSSTVNAAGNYQVVVTNLDNGCSATANTQVSQNTTPPAAVASALGALDCNMSSAGLSGAGSATGANIGYEWSSTGGQLAGSNAQLQAEASAAGLYVLLVTDLLTGCSASDTATVVTLSGDPSALSIGLEAPRCFGECNGALTFDDLGAGLTFALDSEDFSTQNNFTDLCGGSYTLHVQDAFGCKWDTLLLLPEPAEVFVSLGEDTTISLGDSIRIEASASGSATTIGWTPADSACDSLCFDRWVRPFETLRYVATVSDASGCTATDDQTIFVKKTRPVFIPNVFSPNDDGINDVLMVFTGGEVAAVRSFRIFSRWGEALMERNNVRPGNPDDGWDGRFRDRKLDPAVFVYMLEVEYVDGVREVLSGDVMLVW